MDNQIYSKVFTWLFIGLLVTFGVGYLTMDLVISSETFFNLIFSTGGYWFIAIAEIVIALVLGTRIYKMQGSTAKILYLAYCVLTGLTFSAIFILFEVASIIYVFLATAVIFGIFALIGKNTKIDLSKFGIYLLMALLGIIILEVINMFWSNSTLDITICIVALILFVAYIAYDMQKIKRLSNMNIPEENLAVIGAFNLYLDFINIFIRLLELFGKRRD